MLDGDAIICFAWGGMGRTVEIEGQHVATTLSDKMRYRSKQEDARVKAGSDGNSYIAVVCLLSFTSDT